MAEAAHRRRLRDIGKGQTLAAAPRLSLVGVAAADLKVDVTIVRTAPKHFDADNYVASCKALRDGIADAFGVRDDHPCIAFWYEQRHGKPREYRVDWEMRFTRVR